MRLRYHLVGPLFAWCIVAHTTSIGLNDLRTRTTTTADFASFGQGIGLSESTIQTLGDQFAQASNPVEALTVACRTARESLGGAQVEATPIDQTVVEVNWSETCYAYPSCVIQPRNATDVSTSIQIINFFQVKFSVRSGGHSPNPGWSSVGSEGILLDLQRLNSVTLSGNGIVASLGPGGRWSNAMKVLNAQGVSVQGGRLGQVGVGGLLLGGGYFYTSGQFGLAADNAKNFEVVLSNGTIINASSNENADLFWALKGGGPNFGIVTRFDLYTIPVLEIWGKVQIYPTDMAFELLEAFDEWQQHGASDIKSSVAFDIGLDYVTLGLIYSEPATSPTAFAPFDHLEPLQVVVPAINTTFSNVYDILSASYTNTTFRHDYRGASSRINTEFTKEMYTFWRENAVALYNKTGARQNFAIQHVGANLIQQGADKGGNPLGIEAGNQQWWTTLMDWENEGDDDLVRSVSINFTEQWKKRGQDLGVYLPFEYMNDASRDQNPLASYGPENLASLVKVSQKYDAEQLFQTLQNNGFLLSKL
ncbi:hypothetical protein PTNB73_07272 [Pyrenophora teres f. teres]|uniref:FAD-binding PCMH-type domain-containing protein n=1 Tax=Pyrenophora teres f. teres (strain 0-1) TaxID=861557 RepID=E3RYX0_PYRTT|nr:hypothetical protein PTT_14793 [Pyrenophora teres f. teres 0-1]KAE8835545.1 hypothetical protein HRS9122_07815 [Pyrenophora teres f. teres]KAE8861718.1 hypothetical protein PTNB73_07272 [Pyrenophora teres f. teres]